MSFHGDTYASPSHEAVMKTSLSHEESKGAGDGGPEPEEIRLDAGCSDKEGKCTLIRCTVIWRGSLKLHTSETPRATEETKVVNIRPRD